MIFVEKPEWHDPLRIAINQAYRMDETTCVQQLLSLAQLPESALKDIHNQAAELVVGIRKRRRQDGGLDAFLAEYDLSSDEGIALMCLAEALLRIPDKATVDKLIRDKIAGAAWQEHKGQSHSMFVNAMTWGLMLTGKMISPRKADASRMFASLKSVAQRMGAPAIRMAVNRMMKIMSQQFVMAQTIEAGVKRAQPSEKKGYRYSYDMLGEAARTAEDAVRYLQAYQHAIAVVGEQATAAHVFQNPGISVKLSALHPRYEFAQRGRVIKELTPRLLQLAQQAQAANIGLTIDAEEADRLELSLDIIEQVFMDSSLRSWEGLGLAVQSYQRRALPLIDWLLALAHSQKRRLMLRLIKGAYWDSEIKRAQVLGLDGYPVFTRKINTDVSFLACANKIAQHPEAFYPQFATHNAYSVAAVLHLMQGKGDFEFQCLHGMGHTLYDQIVGSENLNIPCRVYAPVGSYHDLLAYLVRRLLENGANTSFVNRISDDSAPIENLIASPVQAVQQLKTIPHPRIPLPAAIYGETRRNAKSLDLSDLRDLEQLDVAVAQVLQHEIAAEPLPARKASAQDALHMICDPSDTRRIVGSVVEATAADVDQALQRAIAAQPSWDALAVDKRATILEKMADLLEQQLEFFMALAVREGGKTLSDALAEVREAVDFCRYYAMQARQHVAQPQVLQGATGEYNELRLCGRGVIACISPWNFPLAIFLGQVTAALVTGNAVIAKPAEQTPLIAYKAVQLLHQAGVPEDVVQLLPGRGEIVGKSLVEDVRVGGVMFTGSTETARLINQTLAARPGAIVPLIAETGGQNAMIVDSSALPEQVVRDVIVSAFGSCGQRCSALRVLYLQQEIADKMINMLVGAMAELKVGDPMLLTTDIGPAIDAEAKTMLQSHFQRMQREAKLLYTVALPTHAQHGHFFAPCAFVIDSIKQLPREVFGPVLHVVKFAANTLDDVIAEINATGYGLTFGVQSRINENVQMICERVRAGNRYVNRSMTGAVVGVQPFGGEGLSGTGPKAGGPYYLHRLMLERTLSIDTTAAGGNASLLSLTAED